MASYFFVSSALVKRYAAEPECAWVESLTDSELAIASTWRHVGVVARPYQGVFYPARPLLPRFSFLTCNPFEVRLKRVDLPGRSNLERSAQRPIFEFLVREL